MQAIADTSDEDLAKYLIGHSVKIPFPPAREYWPGDKRIYAGEAFDVTIKNLDFPGQASLITLLHIIGSTANTKLRRLKHDQTAVTPISAPRTGPDVLVRRAISIAFPQAVLCSDLTNVDGRHVEILHPHNRPKAIVPEATTGLRKLRLRVIPTTNVAEGYSHHCSRQAIVCHASKLCLMLRRHGSRPMPQGQGQHYATRAPGWHSSLLQRSGSAGWNA
eukprot:1505278-Rhodomonas_salina.1